VRRWAQETHYPLRRNTASRKELGIDGPVINAGVKRWIYHMALFERAKASVETHFLRPKIRDYCWEISKGSVSKLACTLRAEDLQFKSRQSNLILP